MLRQTLSADRELETLPTVIAERCVHTRLTQASCRACVEACPVNAWVMDDESLGINTEVCDGCGLCATACPQDAIISQQANVPPLAENRSSVLFACEKAGVNGKDGVIACLHALGLKQVLRLYRGGARRFRVASSDCASCSRRGVLDLPDLLEQLNGLLESRHLTTTTLQVVNREQWNQQAQIARQTFSGPPLSRRAFFRQAATSSITFGMDLARPGEAQALIPPGKLLPRTGRNDVVPFTPRIDSTKCNACHACARLCPQGAIALGSSEEGLEYRLDAECCTGCAMCLDVCNRKAVSVDHWKSQSQFVIPLTAHSCRACGAPFHRPVAQAGSDDVCTVCSRTNHVRNLYQVIEQAQ